MTMFITNTGIAGKGTGKQVRWYQNEPKVSPRRYFEPTELTSPVPLNYPFMAYISGTGIG
jgi:hypothetical protein